MEKAENIIKRTIKKMKFKINGIEYIVIKADKYNEIKKIINEIYENMTEMENKIKEEKNEKV